MIDKASFKSLEKATKDSFFKQKNLIKQVLAGKHVNCRICHQVIVFEPPKKDKTGVVRCKKGCTDIELDMS
ncbi:hypothetical protein [Thalassotalea eurytherma]|uniref:Uncharacterized protein n=1 Tax=Thalassotalea eurytherma TaxID=1144278 RepID=A0ABQ6H3V5_9GAMM|nr:hypothetical protein [Thalassotalea eurytherma]GLX81526.1 hypothetical protein theurythT_09780 [Thalassotalea eurytherma]